MHINSYKKVILLIVYFLVGLGTIHSQTFPSKIFLKKDGLPDSSVLCILQCSKGYLWFGTSRGLCRFNGKRISHFKTESLQQQVIRCIFEDRDGVFWLGTLDDGMFRISPGTGKQLPRLKELENREIFSIAEDTGGVLWLATNAGLYSCKGDQLKAYGEADGLPSTRICEVMVSKSGRVWAAFRSGVYFLEGNRFKKFNIPLNPQNIGDLSLMEDSKGHLWIGTLDGLICFRENAFTVYTTNEGLNDNYVTELFEDADQRIWIGTSSGLNVLSAGIFISITDKNGLAGKLVYSILQDKEGNMWVGTHEGVSCLKSIDIATYTKRDGLIDNSVYNIIQDGKGRYWIGTTNGLNCFNGREFKTFTTRDGLPDNNIMSLHEDVNGKIWIGTFKGMAYFASNTCVPCPPFNRSILVMSQMRDGSIYVGIVDALIRMENGSPVLLPFKGKFPRASSILEDRTGNLWIAYRDGLVKYSPKHLDYFNRENGKLNENKIYTLFEDTKGRLWLGGKAGLSRYQNGSFIHYSTKDGLPDNACFAVREDRQGNLWLGTGRGLVCFDGQNFKTYTSLRHGLPADDWNTSILDNQGRLWLGSHAGITRISPPLRMNQIAPAIYISQFEVLSPNGPQQLGRDSLHLKANPTGGPIRLDYKDNFIDIHYDGLCYRSPESVVYKYKLAGMAPRETQRESVSFANLSPGDYRFEVTAINNDGIESKEPAFVDFEILPPFWGTWWFRFLVIVAFTAFSSFLVILRYKRAGEKSEMEAKNRQLIMAQRMELVGGLAAGTVHDLKNMLSIILSYTKLISRKLTPESDGHQYLGTIKDTAATAVQMTKQILSLARSPSDSQETTDLGKLLEEILDTLEVTLPQKIETSWLLPEERIEFAINPARFQQVMLNLCWNAVHAMPDGGKLTISLSAAEPEGIRLEVSDTGTGIEIKILDNIFEPLFTTKAEGKGTGLGLFVVKRIVMSYNGTIDVHSEVGKGTCFRVSFPCSGEEESKGD
ncbi:MAG: hypothetical protein GY765_25985 [bacterium]|nr:hypothetical protein [bacterium]